MRPSWRRATSWARTTAASSWASRLRSTSTRSGISSWPSCSCGKAALRCRRGGGEDDVAGRLLILGAGAHGHAVADLAEECGWTVAGFTDRTPGPGVLGTDQDLAALSRASRIDGAVVGLGNIAMARRAELFGLIRAAGLAGPGPVPPPPRPSRSSPNRG